MELDKDHLARKLEPVLNSYHLDTTVKIHYIHQVKYM